MFPQTPLVNFKYIWLDSKLPYFSIRQVSVVFCELDKAILWPKVLKAVLKISVPY